MSGRLAAPATNLPDVARKTWHGILPPRLPPMEFRNIYAQGFARVASCTVPVALADAATNAERIIQQVKACHDDGVAVALFPELSLSGYAIDDLLLQDVLLDAVDEAVVTIAEATAKLLPLVVVGAPVRHGNRLYNCGIVIHRGEILGVSPKSFLPNYREFYEQQHSSHDPTHQPQRAASAEARCADGIHVCQGDLHRDATGRIEALAGQRSGIDGGYFEADSFRGLEGQCHLLSGLDGGHRRLRTFGEGNPPRRGAATGHQARAHQEDADDFHGRV